MTFGETGRECRLNRSKIALGHSGTEIHPIGMESLEPTQAAPGFEDPSVFEEGHQKVLVITCQSDNGGRPVATRKLLNDAHRAKTAINIVAQKHRDSLIAGRRFDIGFDAFGHLTQQVVATVDVADAVHPHAIRDPTLTRSRSRRSPKPFQERIQPGHEFGRRLRRPMLSYAHSPLCQESAVQRILDTLAITPPAEAPNGAARQVLRSPSS